jgi:hypothetical protein
MSIAKLKSVIPPPPTVTPIPAGAWEQVEGRLGTKLPADYKALIAEFGPGCIGDFLWIFSPFTTNPNLNLALQFDKITKTDQDLQQTYGHVLPLPLFPAAGGILPAGLTDNGDYVSWLAEAEPDRWPVIVSDSRAPEWERLNLTLTDFIAAIITRERVCGIFPDSFPPPGARFVPAT